MVSRAPGAARSALPQAQLPPALRLEVRSLNAEQAEAIAGLSRLVEQGPRGGGELLRAVDTLGQAGLAGDRVEVAVAQLEDDGSRCRRVAAQAARYVRRDFS